MKRRVLTAALTLFAAMGACSLIPARAAAQRADKDYLSSVEAGKIRDAETTNDRIKLFLMFADDRLTKFQYELEHPSSNKHTEMLNSLFNSFICCVGAAADLVQLVLGTQAKI